MLDLAESERERRGLNYIRREGAEGKSSVCVYTCGNNAKKQCSCVVSMLGGGGTRREGRRVRVYVRCKPKKEQIEER